MCVYFFCINVYNKYNKYNNTPCDSIQVNSKDINVNNLSVPLIKWSDTK